jgi:tetratricopeptide (TPR) repeat protein
MGRDFDGDPQYRAQDLVYLAWETTSASKRAELAREAINIWRGCADGYNLLARQARDLKEAIALYRQAVDAGESALGKRAFEEDVGHFWGILETRPYMRALGGLAGLLWEHGQRDEAVAQYREMLRLNPDDNQGIRYLLAACLVELDRDAELAALLKQYDEDGMAAWAYTKALLAFKQGGDSEHARALLRGALGANRHVPAFLLGRRKLPKALPQFIGVGDESEAVSYVDHNLDGWRQAKGALDWLAHQL